MKEPGCPDQCRGCCSSRPKQWISREYFTCIIIYFLFNKESSFSNWARVFYPRRSLSSILYYSFNINPWAVELTVLSMRLAESNQVALVPPHSCAQGSLTSNWPPASASNWSLCRSFPAYKNEWLVLLMWIPVVSQEKSCRGLIFPLFFW